MSRTDSSSKQYVVQNAHRQSYLGCIMRLTPCRKLWNDRFWWMQKASSFTTWPPCPPITIRAPSLRWVWNKNSLFKARVRLLHYNGFMPQLEVKLHMQSFSHWVYTPVIFASKCRVSWNNVVPLASIDDLASSWLELEYFGRWDRTVLWSFEVCASPVRVEDICAQCI